MEQIRTDGHFTDPLSWTVPVAMIKAVWLDTKVGGPWHLRRRLLVPPKEFSPMVFPRSSGWSVLIHILFFPLSFSFIWRLERVSWPCSHSHLYTYTTVEYYHVCIYTNSTYTNSVYIYICMYIHTVYIYICIAYGQLPHHDPQVWIEDGGRWLV